MLRFVRHHGGEAAVRHDAKPQVSVTGRCIET